MPLPELRGLTSHQTVRGARRRSRKVNAKHTTKRNNAAHKIPSGIKNTRATSLETHLKPIIKKLRNREQIKTKFIDKSNLSQGEVIRNSNSANSTYLSSTVIPEGDVLFVLHRGEAGEPSVTSGHVARTTGVHEPYVLQASSVLLSRKRKSGQMARHWG